MFLCVPILKCIEMIEMKESESLYHFKRSNSKLLYVQNIYISYFFGYKIEFFPSKTIPKI